MEVSIILIILGATLFFGHFLEKMADKTSVPDILGLVALGIIIGPVTGWVDTKSFGVYGSLLSTLVLALILYNSGASLKIENLKKYLAPSMGLVYAGYIITTLVVSALCYLIFSMEFVSALYIGSILGGTSAAVVIVFIKNLKLTDQTETSLIIESAKTDIFTFIIPFTLLGIMKTGEFSGGKVALDFVLTFGLSMLIGVVGALVWSFIINKIPAVKQTKFSTPAFLLIIYGLTEYVGYSGPLMALIFGIALGNIKVFNRDIFAKYIPQTNNITTNKETDFIGEIIFMLKIYFFIYVGMSIQIDDFNILMWASLITLVIYVLRIFIVKFVVSKDTPVFDKSIISIMAPKGLATAVMGSLPLQQGAADGEIIQSLLFSGLILSIVFTVILFFLVDKKITLPFYEMIFDEKTDEKNL